MLALNGVAYADALRRDSRARSKVNALKPKWGLHTSGQCLDLVLPKSEDP
jgi:hypothetical protein